MSLPETDYIIAETQNRHVKQVLDAAIKGIIQHVAQRDKDRKFEREVKRHGR